MSPTRLDHEQYVELVLGCVEQVPRGRVTTYGAIAEVVGQVAGGGGPRLVGSVMAHHGGPVPWWRVVRADGSLPPSHDVEARPYYLEEGTPLRPTGCPRPRARRRSRTWRRGPRPRHSAGRERRREACRRPSRSSRCPRLRRWHRW